MKVTRETITFASACLSMGSAVALTAALVAYFCWGQL